MSKDSPVRTIFLIFCFTQHLWSFKVTVRVSISVETKSGMKNLEVKRKQGFVHKIDILISKELIGWVVSKSRKLFGMDSSQWTLYLLLGGTLVGKNIRDVLSLPFFSIFSHNLQNQIVHLVCVWSRKFLNIKHRN